MATGGPPDGDPQHEAALPGLTPQNSDNLPPLSNSKRVLGCVSNRYHLHPEDPAPNGQKEYTQWQDPFRMSVLDFQHRALDKLAEVLSIYLETKGALMTLKGSEREDVNKLLGLLKHNANGFAQELECKHPNPNQVALEDMCQILRKARNAFAHQKYNKTHQSTEDIHVCQTDLPEEYKTTRTFEHTSKVIDYCTDLTERVAKVTCLPSEEVIFSYP